MTQAAQQCREYLEEKYPGVRISRRKCKDTTSGGISQHSAYNIGTGDDSNALDIMGVTGGTWDQNVELIQEVVDDLTPNLHEWSIRKILWQVAAHYGHAHIDFYPMINIHKWCATRGVTPPWRYTDGTIIYRLDPEPENGRYDGPTEEESMPPLNIWVKYIRKVDIIKMGTDNIIEDGEVAYFTGIKMWMDADNKLNEDHPDWENLYNAYRTRVPIWAV